MAGELDPNKWSSEFKTTDPNVVYQIGVREMYQDKNRNFTMLRVVVSIKSNGTTPVPINGSLNIMLDDSSYIMMYDGSQKVQAYWQYVYDYSFEIPHKPDGTKALSIRANWTTSFFNSVGVIWNLSLSKIDRVSTFTCPDNVNFGSSLSVVITKKVDTLRHKLTYSFGGSTGTIGTNIDTSSSWSVPISLASKIPNANSGTCRITCTTMDGTNVVGSVYQDITLNVPSYTISVSQVTSDPTGYEAIFGGWVNTKSKVKVQVTASSSYGATIKTIQITVAGTTSTQNPFTTNAINLTAGNNAVSVTVTDSRGRKRTITGSYLVLSYTKPTITKLVVNRCDASGVLDDGGDHMKIEYACSIDPVGNNNSKRIKVEYKKESVTSWTTAVNVAEYSRNTSVIVSADINSSYDIRFYIADYFSETTRLGKLATAFTLMDFRTTGRGMAVGKVSEEDILDIALAVKMNHSIYGLTISDVNFNTLTSVGKYILRSNASASGCTNIPVKKAGSVYVMCPNSHSVIAPTEAWNYFIQIFLPYDGSGLYYRHFYTDADKVVHFNDWKHFGIYPMDFKPYYEKGDTIQVEWNGAGYATSSSQIVYVTIPIDKPIMGNPTITVSVSARLRQNGNYTHGSTSSAYASPASYQEILHKGTGLAFGMKFSSTTNATNNDSIGVYLTGSITLS